MFNRPHSNAARAIFLVLLWGVVTELTIVALGVVTGRSLPALIHLGLLYLGSYAPLLFAMARQHVLDKQGS